MASIPKQRLPHDILQGLTQTAEVALSSRIALLIPRLCSATNISQWLLLDCCGRIDPRGECIISGLATDGAV